LWVNGCRCVNDLKVKCEGERYAIAEFAVSESCFGCCRSGFVAHWLQKAAPITLACNAAPPAVFQGESVTVTGTAGSVSTKKNNNVLYTWSGDGVTGNGSSASVNTSAQNPGSYTVKGTVKEGKKGKEAPNPARLPNAPPATPSRSSNRRR